MDLALCIDIISHCQDEGWDSKGVESSGSYVEKYAVEDGLSDDHLVIIANAVCSGKLGAQLSSKLLQCLVPEDIIPDAVVAKIASWVFSDQAGPSLERICYRWFVALLQYKAGGKEVLAKHFDYFLAVLRNQKHLEVSACILLYYLLEPCDVRPYIIRSLLLKHEERSFSQLNSLLGKMKEMCGSKMPAWIKSTPLQSPHSSYDVAMQNLLERRLNRTLMPAALKWRTATPNYGGSVKLQRLIPMVEYLERRIPFAGAGAVPTKPLHDYVSVADLGCDVLQVNTPAQMMSLLANEGGFLMIITAPEIQKTRFLRNLEATLHNVFLLNKGAYSRTEKEFLLTAVMALQVYIQESLPEVSKFLLKYLLMWNGRDLFREVHALIEYLSFASHEDITMLTEPLRQQFRCGSLEERTSLLISLKAMMINMLVRSRRSVSDAPAIMTDCDYECEVNQAIKALGEFVGEMVTEQLIWTKEKDVRNFLNYAIEFYTEVVLVEQEADLGASTVLPSMLVYTSLMSNSRMCIDSVCGLLLAYHTAVRERLTLLCAIEEYQEFFNNELSSYFMDIYRALFSNLKSHPDVQDGIFSQDFLDQVEKLQVSSKEKLAVSPTSALTTRNSLAWRISSNEPVSDATLKVEYANTWRVKLLVEQLLQS